MHTNNRMREKKIATPTLGGHTFDLESIFSGCRSSRGEQAGTGSTNLQKRRMLVPEGGEQQGGPREDREGNRQGLSRMRALVYSTASWEEQTWLLEHRRLGGEKEVGVFFWCLFFFWGKKVLA